MSRIIEKLEATTEKRKKVQRATDTIARIIALPLKPWDTTGHIANNMKRLLCVVTLWLRMRHIWIGYATDLGTCSDYNRDAIEPYKRFNNLHVGTWGSGWNQGKYDSSTIKAKALVAEFPEVDELKATAKEVREAEKLSGELDTLFKQSTEMLDETPAYMEVKKRLPIGGRLFFSVLLAVQRGTLSTTKPDQNNLFGFEDDTDGFSRLLKHAQRRLRADIVEKKGRAPSWKCAIDETPGHGYGGKPFTQDMETRLRVFGKHLPDSLGGVSSHTYVNSPTLLKIAKLDGYKAFKMIRKIQGMTIDARSQNDTPTVYTSRPERLLADDYVVQGAWLESESTYGRQRDRKIVRGWIYFRANWSDCIHSETQLTSREVSEKLDRSASFRLRWKYQLEALSARVRCARMLRRLRNVTAVCIDDSYATGNCKVGTQQFMSQLGMDTDVRCIAGKVLAISWREKGYPQFDRFASCIVKAEERIKRTQDEFVVWASN